MEFNPSNPVVKRCLEGMAMADSGNTEAARQLFLQAWREATDDLEKFIAAYYVARHQENDADRLQWYETALQAALAVNDNSVHSAFATLYAHIADGYNALGMRPRPGNTPNWRPRLRTIRPTAGPFIMERGPT